MRLNFQQYYRLYGVRTVNQLANPRVFTIDQFQFPKDAVYHSVNREFNLIRKTNDYSGCDIDPNLSYLKTYGNKRIPFDVVLELLDDAKSIKSHLNLNPVSLTRHFLQQHNNYKFVRDAIIKNADPLNLTIINYGYLDAVYRYMNMPMSEYYHWKNTEEALYSNVNKLAPQSNRQHFIFYDISNIVPSQGILRVYQDKENRALARIFDTIGKRLVLEIWKAIDPQTRAMSVFRYLDRANYSKVNLVLNRNGKWSLLNLENLFKWIEEEENTLENTKFKPIVIRKLFLKLLIQFTSNTQPLTDLARGVMDGAEGVNIIVKGKTTAVDPEEAGSDENEPNEPVEEPQTTIIDTPQPTDTVVSIDSIDDIDFSDHSNIDSLLSEIDKDLKELDDIQKRNLEQRNIKLDKDHEIIDYSQSVVAKDINENLTPVEGLRTHLSRLADFGVMSANEYRNAEKAIFKYETLTNPYNTEQLLKDSIQLSKEDTAINSTKTQIAENINLQDVSMKSTTINTFDQHYVDHILKKDMVNMVNNIQRAGVIIENYEIKEDSSVLGDYEYHRLKLKPIDGVSSVVNFKIPKIKPDGTFTSNGNRYLQRKQRVDLSVRKIKPNIVALTSYYGKTFIKRSEFSKTNVFDSIEKHINKELYSEINNSNIVKTYTGNVYNNYFKAPFMFSGLSQRYREIETHEYQLVFDVKTIEETIGAEAIQAQLKQNLIYCGYNQVDKSPIYMDRDGFIYKYDKEIGNYTEINTIYEILGIKDPAIVDYATIRIFAKSIPLAIVLGYLTGLEPLLKTLDIKYAKVPNDVKINDDKRFKVVFKDFTLFIERKDFMGTMIFGGLLQFKDIIKRYEIEHFNDKDIYFNLLESMKLGSIYTKEIDNLNDLFIDPITLEILETMKINAKTFSALVIEGTKLLEDYTYPDFQDMRYQRIRGYERIPGAIYHELVQAIRDHRFKNIRGKSKIEMNPYAVWKQINNDPSKKMLEEINPIQDIKQKESVTLVGEGGRSKDTLAKDTRAYHITDIGVTSEATPASADVGINTYLTGDPKFTSLRGLASDAGKITATNIFSSPALAAPCSENDDQIGHNK